LNAGNILNLIVCAAGITGIAFLWKRNKQQGEIFKYLILIFISFILLLFAWFLTTIKLPLQRIYILQHPISHVFSGAIFIIYQFFTFAVVSIIWMRIINIKDLLWLRGVVNSVLITLLILTFAYYYSNLGRTFKSDLSDSPGKGNTAVVLGAAVWSDNTPSPTLASRNDKALELFNSGIVDQIVLTGSNAPGELSEAEVSFIYLKAKDVDTSRVQLETETTSTSAQIRYIKDVIIPNEDLNSVIIISDSYHLPRVKEICRFFNVDAKLTASELTLSFEDRIYYQIRESIALSIFWFFAL
jgi:vancomycin permeability regulator SanA